MNDSEWRDLKIILKVKCSKNISNVAIVRGLNQMALGNSKNSGTATYADKSWETYGARLIMEAPRGPK